MARRPPNLHLRIVGLFLIAILPPAVLAIALAAQGYQENIATKDAALRQAAALVAAREGALIESMRRVLISFAAQPAVASGEEPACSALLGAAVEANPAFIAMGVLRPDGTFGCIGGVESYARVEEGQPWLRAAAEKAHGGRRFAVASAEQPRESRIAAAVPVDDGTEVRSTLVLFVRPGYLGSASLTVPHFESATAALLSSDWRPVSFYLTGEAPDWLPRDRPFDARSLTSVAAAMALGLDGRQYVYTAAPVAETDLFVLNAAPADRIYRDERRQLVLSISFPLALLVLSVATAWFAVDRLVLRWIDQLRDASSAYGAGQLEARVHAPDGMPAEIKDLADSFNTMAERVQERSLELERALAAKTRLLRELHHRVKNNFQVIASLLALQKRSLDREQKNLLRYPEDRVQALATAYRLSYASGDIGHVDLIELIEENVSYMRQSAEVTASLLCFDAESEPIEVDLDTAIPLSLLLAELLASFTDAAKCAGRPARVSLRRAEDESLVVLVAGPPPPEVAPESAALSARLSQAFVQQLGGRLEIEDGDPTVARVVIPRIKVELPSSTRERAQPESAAW